MQLELNTSQPVRNIRVFEAFYKDRPRMRMIIGRADRSRVRFAKWHCCRADNEWAANLCQLDALAELVIGRHLRGKRCSKDRVWMQQRVLSGIDTIAPICDNGSDRVEGWMIVKRIEGRFFGGTQAELAPRGR